MNYWKTTTNEIVIESLDVLLLESSYFSVSNGVRQGGILSPKLFSVYVDDLSVALSATKTSCVINDKSVNHAFYADDLCIMSASPAGLQKLIDICYNYTQYSVQNSLTFNPTKSVCGIQLSQRNLSCIVLPWF